MYAHPSANSAAPRPLQQQLELLTDALRQRMELLHDSGRDTDDPGTHTHTEREREGEREREREEKRVPVDCRQVFHAKRTFPEPSPPPLPLGCGGTNRPSCFAAS